MARSDPGYKYDELPLWSAPFGLTLLDTIRVRKGMYVLDIGSGSGFPMLEIAGRIGSSGKVFGIDPLEESRFMIGEKIRLKEITHAEIITATAENLPFGDNYFDLIVSNNGLNNVTDQEASFQECYRVAKPSSQLVTTMNLPGTMIEFYEVFEQVLLACGLREEIARMYDHIRSKRKPVDYLQLLISKSGFTVHQIKTREFKLRFATGTAFLNYYLIKTYFANTWKSLLPEKNVSEVFHALEEKLNEKACRAGELVFSVPYVCFDASAEKKP